MNPRKIIIMMFGAFFLMLMMGCILFFFFIQDGEQSRLRVWAPMNITVNNVVTCRNLYSSDGPPFVPCINQNVTYAGQNYLLNTTSCCAGGSNPCRVGQTDEFLINPSNPRQGERKTCVEGAAQVFGYAIDVLVIVLVAGAGALILYARRSDDAG